MLELKDLCKFKEALFHLSFCIAVRQWHYNNKCRIHRSNFLMNNKINRSILTFTSRERSRLLSTARGVSTGKVRLSGNLVEVAKIARTCEAILRKWQYISTAERVQYCGNVLLWSLRWFLPRLWSRGEKYCKWIQWKVPCLRHKKSLFSPSWEACLARVPGVNPRWHRNSTSETQSIKGIEPTTNLKAIWWLQRWWKRVFLCCSAPLRPR